jgi:hypothetical protein
MAYTPNTLRLMVYDVEGTVAKRWSYTTAADSDATITGAGYFSDGQLKGMVVGDMVEVVATTGPKMKAYQCTAVNTTTGTATVSTPTAIT